MKDENPLDCALGYITHLDGIRAVALVGVLAFHFEVAHFTGGYIGVDVFLVLSGYLMTRNLFLRIQEDCFNLRTFYVSRFWRLYPSSLVTILCTLVAAYFIFPPDLALRTAESGGAAMSAVSNIYFYSQDSYFDVGSIQKPLLHTWSLSLEEQYYAILPAVMMLCSAQIHKHGEKTALRRIMSFASLFSFLLSFMVEKEAPEMSFFLLPARLFQFGVGGLTFLYNDALQTCLSNQYHDFIAAFGALAILGSYYTLPTQSPVYYSMPAVLGTAALIACPGAWISANVLSSRPLRHVGQMAYSAYLVHWPLWVFSRFISESTQTSFLTRLPVMAMATWALAFCLRFLIEIPWRHPPRKVAGVVWLVFATGSMLASCIYSKGWPSRTSADSGYPSSHLHRQMCRDVRGPYNQQDVGFTSGCIVRGSAQQLSVKEFNKYGQKPMPPVRALVVGNSYAKHLIGAFDSIVRNSTRQSLPFMFSFRGGCPLRMKVEDGGPVTSRSGKRIDAHCHDQDRATWDLIAETRNGSLIFLANDWAGASAVHEATELAKEMKRIGEHRVVVVSAAPSYAVEDRSSLACYDFKRYPPFPVSRLARLLRCPKSHRVVPARIEAHLEFMKLKQRPSIDIGPFSYIDLWQPVCHRERGDSTFRCQSWVDKREEHLIFKRDGAHYSLYGSQKLFQPLRTALLRLE